ncbi:SanA/YdcF family protein [Maribacter hydrothermalis]|uniref:Protein SanA n=1 Tax=Maribacter hydrothermalis TaxID=1836467 RepID=A0A1B7ZFM3_9FLAO|nr:ElyC/SanA/YdcF family protein [Maribacter hydrothermalis]APQ17875.1 protein SanA [Maribacter hydrothermalis]OBR42348.1 protein SanA [Maribacter hydrothermalis]
MLRTLFKIASALLVVLLVTIVICNIVISNTTAGKTYSDISIIPSKRVGLVLGTSNRLTSGSANPYYTNRINATIALYKAGKIKFILVSGDNGSIYYNEPNTIKKDLINAGIPDEVIFLDYAGFRTLDSMVRAKYIFGLDEVTVISQKFHNERAIYIAQSKGLNAIGFNAQDIPTSEGLKVQIREYLARVKVFIDMLLNTQPKFYGTTIEIK